MAEGRDLGAGTERLAPRLLTLEQAADYLQVPRREIHRQGVGRIQMGIRVRYDRHALDAWVDGQTGQARSLPPHEEDDTPEAALERIHQRERNAARRS